MYNNVGFFLIRRLSDFISHVKASPQEEGGILYRLEDDSLHGGAEPSFINTKGQ